MREPAPFVTRWRNLTIANGDSITFEVRRRFQCSAGKSKKVSSASASFPSVVTAFSYLAPYSPAKRAIASRASRGFSLLTCCAGLLAALCVLLLLLGPATARPRHSSGTQQLLQVTRRRGVPRRPRIPT